MTELMLIITGIPVGMMLGLAMFMGMDGIRNFLGRFGKPRWKIDRVWFEKGTHEDLVIPFIPGQDSVTAVHQWAQDKGLPRITQIDNVVLQGKIKGGKK